MAELTKQQKAWNNAKNAHPVRWKQNIAVHGVATKDTIISRIHGCLSGCPHYGTKRCPYGVGVSRYNADITDKSGVVIRKTGDLIDQYVSPQGVMSGICPERVAELKLFVENANTSSGLRVLRTEALAKLKADRDYLADEIKKMVSARGGPLAENQETGDVKIIEAIKELSVLDHKYLERLEGALVLEDKADARKEESAYKLSADDLNRQLANARVIDVQAIEQEKDGNEMGTSGK